MSRDIYLEVGGVKSLWLISKEFREYCKEEYPEIKDENYWINKTEEFIKDHHGDPTNKSTKKLDNIFGIK